MHHRTHPRLNDSELVLRREPSPRRASRLIEQVRNGQPIKRPKEDDVKDSDLRIEIVN